MLFGACWAGFAKCVEDGDEVQGLGACWSEPFFHGPGQSTLVGGVGGVCGLGLVTFWRRVPAACEGARWVVGCQKLEPA